MTLIALNTTLFGNIRARRIGLFVRIGSDGLRGWQLRAPRVAAFAGHSATASRNDKVCLGCIGPLRIRARRSFVAIGLPTSHPVRKFVNTTVDVFFNDAIDSRLTRGRVGRSIQFCWRETRKVHAVLKSRRALGDRRRNNDVGKCTMVSRLTRADDNAAGSPFQSATNLHIAANQLLRT